MPKFLKNNTIVLLDGGVESYLMALYGMAMPTLRNLRKPETKQAPIVGLYGAAAELLVKACLVQAKGVEAMYKDGNIASGVYKTKIVAFPIFGEILMTTRSKERRFSIALGNLNYTKNYVLMVCMQDSVVHVI